MKPSCLIHSFLVLTQNDRHPGMNEADTCRILVEPKLSAAGWETPPHRVVAQPMIAPGRMHTPSSDMVFGDQRLSNRERSLKHQQVETQAELAAVLPAVLDRAFRGEL